MVNEIFRSQYTAAQIEASLGKTPTINYSTRTWMLWDITTMQYVDTGVPVDTEILIDDTLSIPNAAADAEKTGEIGKALAFVTPKTALHFLQKAMNNAGGYYDSTTRCATEHMTLAAGTYRFSSVRDDIRFLLWRGSLYGGDQSNVLVQVDGATEIAVVVKFADNSSIDPETASRSVWIERFTPQEPKEERLNGTGMMILGDEPLCHSYITNYHALTSLVYKMPKSGIQVGKIMSGGNTNGYCVTRFYRMVSGQLVNATDYIYGNILWNGGTPTYYPTKGTIYYPYEENLYFSVVLTKTESETDYGSSSSFVSYGSVRDGNGRLTNLSQASCGYGVNPAPNQGVTGPYPSFTLWAGSGYATQQHFYGTVIRLRDAAAICCTSDLSLLCWWYDSDGRLLGSVYGNSLANYAFTGVNNIDLTPYGEDGYAFVLIRAPFTAREPVEGQTRTVLDEQTMGGIHLRDHVLNNVFVRYKNRTTINHTGGLHPILADNIEKFKRLDMGKTFGFEYSGPVTHGPLRMGEMPHTAPVLYAGNTVTNTFLQNVSLKSFITALKNPNSQIYRCDYIPSREHGEIPAGDGAITTRGFGTTCNSLPFILYGWPWAVRANAWDQESVEFPGVTVYRNFDFINRYDEVRPGDWIVGVSYADTEQGREEDDAHVLMVTDVIYVDGAASAIECIENYPPMARYRYLFLDPMLDQFNLQFSRREPVDTFYQILVRPDRSKIVPLEEAFGPLTTDYSVGSLMCNRGTDSVYCPLNAYCYITISDSAVQKVIVYRNGSKEGEIDLNNLPETVSGVQFYHSTNFTGPTDYRVIDIIQWIRARNDPEGYYTLKVDGDAAVQESFFVTARIPQTVVNTASGNTVGISMTNLDDVVYTMACYLPPEDDPDYSATWNRVKISIPTESIVIDPNTGRGTATVPKIVTYKGKEFTFNWSETIYKTTYGTYWVMRDDQDEGVKRTYYNSDGGLNDPVYD